MSDTTGLPSWTWFASPGGVLYNFGAKYEDTDKGVVETLKLLAWDVQWQGRAIYVPSQVGPSDGYGPGTKYSNSAI